MMMWPPPGKRSLLPTGWAFAAPLSSIVTLVRLAASSPSINQPDYKRLSPILSGKSAGCPAPFPPVLAAAVVVAAAVGHVAIVAAAAIVARAVIMYPDDDDGDDNDDPECFIALEETASVIAASAVVVVATHKKVTSQKVFSLQDIVEPTRMLRFFWLLFCMSAAPSGGASIPLYAWRPIWLLAALSFFPVGIPLGR